MHVPGIMEKVRLAGVDEVYMVLTVDHQQEAVDLLPIRFGGERLRTVPFSSVEALPVDVARDLLRRSRQQ